MDVILYPYKSCLCIFWRHCHAYASSFNFIQLFFFIYFYIITDSEHLEVSTVYAITPTYVRPTQRVDLISLCHTLMHVPNITWIVIEDSEKKTQHVRDILTKQCKSVTSVHLTAKSSQNKAEGRGVNQRNAGLSWIRQTCGSNETTTTTTTEKKCNGVVYLMDDDNKYDLRLFQEVGLRALSKLHRAAIYYEYD